MKIIEKKMEMSDQQLLKGAAFLFGISLEIMAAKDLTSTERDIYWPLTAGLAVSKDFLQSLLGRAILGQKAQTQ